MPNPSPGEPTNLGPTGRTVAFNVQRLRKLRGQTQADLAALLTDAGRRMSLSSLSEIEREKRRVDVDDLAALAASLQVAPNDLLLPPVQGKAVECEITGLGVVDTQNAWKWAHGVRPMAWAPTPKGWGSRSRVRHVLSPEEEDLQERRQMVEDLLEAADRRHRTLSETRGVPVEEIAAAAAEIEQLERIDPADQNYWRNAPYDPARRKDDGPRPTVAEQVARIPGLTDLVTVKPDAKQ